MRFETIPAERTLCARFACAPCTMSGRRSENGANGRRVEKRRWRFARIVTMRFETIPAERIHCARFARDARTVSPKSHSSFYVFLVGFNFRVYKQGLWNASPVAIARAVERGA